MKGSDVSALGSDPLVVVVVLAYEAEQTVATVLDRIPARIPGARLAVLVSDDASSDGTVRAAEGWANAHADVDIAVVGRAVNLGYGGNQIACYRWAAQRGADVVVMVHGDGQYPPERIGDLVEPILSGRVDAAFGSRMRVRGAALEGKMPWRRYVGNRFLTAVLNLLGGADFSEWFSGFRAYRIATLDLVDLDRLPVGFSIDIALLNDILRVGGTVGEIAIPTRYTDEISRVPLIRTGLLAVGHGVRRGRWARVRRAASTTRTARGRLRTTGR